MGFGVQVRFASKTKGDILLNFVDQSWQGDSSKLLMALHVVLVRGMVVMRGVGWWDGGMVGWWRLWRLWDGGGRMVVV